MKRAREIVNLGLKERAELGLKVRQPLKEIVVGGLAKGIEPELKEIIKEQKKPRIILLLKVVDSLEIVKRDFSKELLKEITPLGDKIVVGFATRSLGSRKKFSANRNWIVKFINEHFKVEDDFELGGERYLVFRKKD